MILGMAITVNNMEGMVAFYEFVFGLKFTSGNLYETVLNHAKWYNFNIQFCLDGKVDNKSQIKKVRNRMDSICNRF